MSSAETDKYIQNQKKLKRVGVDIPVTAEDGSDMVTKSGIPVTKGPRVILNPAFGILLKKRSWTKYQETGTE
jgi:UDP-sugar pyrophosphorylase